MRTHLLALLSLAPISVAQSGVIDQSSPVDPGSTFTASQTTWQQQVRAAKSGQLEGVDVFIEGTHHLSILPGDAYSTSAPLWQGDVFGSDTDAPTFVDLSAASLHFNAGQTFTLEFQVGGGELGRNNQGNAGYPEPLCFLNVFVGSANCSDSANPMFPGARLGFRTWVLEELGTRYCGATPNSTGSPASISASGSVSVSANDLVLKAAPVPPHQFGVFFYGDLQSQVPFGNGLRCVDGTLARLGPVNSGALGVLLTAVDYQSPASPANQILSGQTWYFQAWHRDSVGAGFNLSDGLELTFTP